MQLLRHIFEYDNINKTQVKYILCYTKYPKLNTNKHYNYQTIN